MGRKPPICPQNTACATAARAIPEGVNQGHALEPDRANQCGEDRAPGPSIAVLDVQVGPGLHEDIEHPDDRGVALSLGT